MLRWIGKNISTFFLALILAIGVWAAAVNASDPNEELIYPKPVPVEIIGQDTNLLITNDYSQEIALTLRAPRSIWKQLTANQDNIHAILDLSGLSAGEYTLQPQIQIGTQPTRIVSVVPEKIHITLEELTTRKLPIEVNLIGEPAIGYRAGTPQWEPQEVTVSGAKSLVDKAETVRAFFNLSNTREDIDETLSLEILDKDKQPLRGVDLTPQKIALHIPVSQQGGYRDVAVKVGVTGQVANLYRLTNISVFPPVITVYSADPQLINELPGVVETEPLDINGISEDISARLKVILPEKVSIVGDQSVLVQVSVEAILGSLTISEKPIEIINLAPALFAELSPQTVDVIVSGPLPALDTLTPEDLRVIVNVADLTPGEYQLTPIVEILNEEIRVESILPESIKITISDSPPATPTSAP